MTVRLIFLSALIFCLAFEGCAPSRVKSPDFAATLFGEIDNSDFSQSDYQRSDYQRVVNDQLRAVETKLESWKAKVESSSGEAKGKRSALIARIEKKIREVRNSLLSEFAMPPFPPNPNFKQDVEKNLDELYEEIESASPQFR